VGVGGAAGTGTGGAATGGSAGTPDGGTTDGGAADAADTHLASHVDGGLCIHGFAHCTTNPQDKCETSIETADNCGGCGSKCTGATPVCVLTRNGVAYRCEAACPAGLTHCGNACIDLQTTPNYCGSCDVSCIDQSSNVAPVCKAGVCQHDTCYAGFGTCGAATPACTTRLDSTQNCGACGNPSCNVAHTLLTCSGGAACDHPVCAAGFANCDTTSPDCETAQGTASACFPTYRGTLIYSDELDIGSIAVGADGSTYLAGTLGGVVDLDPSPAKDLRGPLGVHDAVISRVTPDGKEAWAIKLGNGPPSDTSATGLVMSGTSLLAVGTFSGDVDFDPGPGVSLGHLPAGSTGATWVASYSLDGALQWVRTFTGTAACTGNRIAADPTGAVYVAGFMQGTCDFGTAAASDKRTSPPQGGGFLVKLGADGKPLWSRAIAGDAMCLATFEHLAASADGSAWLLGGTSEGTCNLEGTALPLGDAFVASYTAAGDVRFALRALSENVLAAAPDGSVYLGGYAGGGAVDFDLGAGTASRTLQGNDGNQPGFVEQLAADGTFRWVQTIDRVPVVAVAPLADSGVVLVGTQFTDGNISGIFASRLGPTSTPAWSLGVDDPNNAMGLFSVAASGSSFVILGGTDADVPDVVPGPATVSVPAHSLFLERWDF
jgi:hypothetical protein